MGLVYEFIQRLSFLKRRRTGYMVVLALAKGEDARLVAAVFSPEVFESVRRELFSMQWSKIKTRLRLLVTPALRSRVDFHLTVYRSHHNDHGGICKCGKARELWITLDKVKIFRASYCKYAHEVSVMWREAGYSPWDRGPSQDSASRHFVRRELHDPTDVVDVLRAYLDGDPRDALRSADPIMRALAIIDGRIGVRTLEQFQIADDEHSLVRLFYFLRCPDMRSLPRRIGGFHATD